MKKIVLIVLYLLFWADAFAQNKETRPLASFDKVKIRGLSQIIIQKGSEEKIELASKNGNLKDIEIKVDKKGFLIIQRKLKIWQNIKSVREDNNVYYNNNDIKAVLTFKNLTYLSNSGSGDIVVYSPIENQEFTVRSSGSGSIQIKELKTDYLEAKVSGSGDIKVLKGFVQKQKLRVSGSGTMNMLGLESKEAETRVSGSGDLYVYVTQSHDSKVSGSGDIRYKGSPENSIEVKRGSGSVRQIKNK